jgi:6-phosphogluconolactonase
MEVPAVGEVADVQTAAEVYADRLRHEGTGGFDLVMLGMGPDGHVASLFPGHPALDVTDAITVAVTDSPKPPPERVSLTFEALLRRTGAVWLLVSGEEKAEAVARALAPEGSVAETPARAILERAGADTRVTWWLDEAAASRL